MAETKVTLKHGFRVGDHQFMVATIRETTSGDVIEANEESEKVVMVPTEDARGNLVTEAQLVTSPTLVGINVMRRQIVAIDDYSGPLSLAEVKSLHPEDLNLLQAGVNQLDQLAAKALEGVAERGRDEGAGESA